MQGPVTVHARLVNEDRDGVIFEVVLCVQCRSRRALWPRWPRRARHPGRDRRHGDEASVAYLAAELRGEQVSILVNNAGIAGLVDFGPTYDAL